MNLVEVLKPRAALIGEILANRMNLPEASDYNRAGHVYYGGGSWRNYKQSEGLNGVQVNENTVHYRRPSNDKAVLAFTNIRPVSGEHQDYGPEQVIDRNAQDHAEKEITLPAGATFDDTVSFTFSKTTSRLEAYKQSLRTAFEQSLRLTGSLVGAELKAQEELTADFERRYGNDETQSNTVSKHLTLKGPAHVVYRATRSIDRVQHEVTAALNYEHIVSMNDDVQISSGQPAPTVWDTIASVFVPSTAPATRARYSWQWSTLAGLLATISDEGNQQDPFYDLFYQRPEVAGVVDAVRAAPNTMKVKYTFDRVKTEDSVVPITP